MRNLFRISRVTLASGFVGLALGLGYIFALIPNVEGITFTVFTSGVILGSSWGITVGVVSYFLFSLFNPYGLAPLPVLIAQLLGGAIIGACGGYLRKAIIRLSGNPKSIFYLGLASGVILTLIYDILTNIGAYFSIGTPSGSIWVFILGGIVFSVVHIVSNGLLFTALSFLWTRLVRIVDIR